ncbi:unnamed protein product [Gemmataceae bacterium]|nr:unnamed protein product [Gemmataceae bacterium]VTT96439.1 unnamed protein product [Gemmataceae bacterium]
MAVRLSCPSCNTEFTRPELPANRRAACPRCGDEFPVRAWQDVPDAAPAAAPATPVQPPPPAPVRRKPVFSRALVLAVVVACVGIGVSYWVARDRGQKAKQAAAAMRPEGAVLPPAELEGLGYLPADTNVAFAVQPGAVVAYARQTNQDPRDVVIQAGVPARVLDTLTRAGLTLGQIDHIAGGTSLGDAVAEIRLTLVLVLRRPLDDPDAFLAALEAKHNPANHEQYGVTFAGLQLLLARPSPTVCVLGFDAKKDFAAVAERHGPGGTHYRADLARRIATQVPADAAAWVATADGQWAEKPAVLMVIDQFLQRKEWLPVLARGRAGIAALVLGERPRLWVIVKCVDEEIAARTRRYFASRVGADPKVQHGGEGDVAFLDLPIDPARISETVRKFLIDAGEK